MMAFLIHAKHAMFDFLFKRSASKPSEPNVAVAEQAAAAAAVSAQTASRRAEQVAQAHGAAGNEAAAVEFILKSEFADARLIAAGHVHGQALLEQVHQAMRNVDRRVAKLVQGKLDLLRHQHAEQQKAQAGIDSARRLLADDKLSPNQVAELDRLWLVIKATPELTEEFSAVRSALATRLEAQVALQRAALDALAELRRLPGSALSAEQLGAALERLTLQHAAHLASPEWATLPRHLAADFSDAQNQVQASLAALAQHQAAFDARQGALAEWQLQDVATLDAATLKRTWSGLPRVPENELSNGLQQQFEALLATLPAPPQKLQEAVKEVREETRAAREPARDNKISSEDFLKTLDGMEAALQEGQLHLASELDKTLRDIKHGRLTPAQSDRLASVRAEFKRLADWARWGGNVSREELVKAGEELPALALPMAELAKKVGSLRERWKSLDTLSGPAPKSLWERFDAACTAAYAPAALHFKQLAEERHGNAARAADLIAETQALALASADSGDWKQVAADSQRLRQAWGRLGTIDRKEKKRLDGEFNSALDALSKPLDNQRQIETARREQLIVEVGLLKPTERNTVDMLKALQEKWQELAKALPLERRAEQALWQRFRAACDDIFARRKETAHAADHERREHLHAREAVCASLETAVIPDDLDDKRRAAFIAGLLRDARQAWNAAGQVPRASEAKIEQRYQAALAGLQQHADAIAERAGAAQANALRDKLRLCQSLENALVQLDDGIEADEWTARWSGLPPLDAQYERLLQARFNSALKALQDERAAYGALLEVNRAKLLDEVLRLEIVAGVDSGAEFSRERLKMQVEVLQSSLKSGQKPLSQLSQLQQLCAMPALVDTRTASRIEVLLRRIGGAK